jgi:hypothetical protein
VGTCILIPSVTAPRPLIGTLRAPERAVGPLAEVGPSRQADELKGHASAGER